MNMIVCLKDCRHQQDGCCHLSHTTSLSMNSDKSCGYYEKSDTPPLPGHVGHTILSPKDLKSL